MDAEALDIRPILRPDHGTDLLWRHDRDQQRLDSQHAMAVQLFADALGMLAQHGLEQSMRLGVGMIAGTQDQISITGRSWCVSALAEPIRTASGPLGSSVTGEARECRGAR